ncbi:hypothetical protein F2Q69_00052081 [Brassica cretica]|uniref:Uncharacterized protein n=1 Tax=Brassica cretica TaxID=69181 RepID=A0A8S9MVJ2_BRACR|nr:hypothetical protein F2Q69_00052081 [Brassica cretica]
MKERMESHEKNGVLSAMNLKVEFLFPEQSKASSTVTASTGSFRRQVGGFGCGTVLLLELPPRMARGLAFTLLFPGGLPGFLFGACGWALMISTSSFVISSSRGPSLSIMGTLPAGPLTLGESTWTVSARDPSLLEIGIRG